MKLNKARLLHLEELAARLHAEWDGCSRASENARQELFAAQARLENFQDAMRRGSASASSLTTTILPNGGAIRTSDLNRISKEEGHDAGATTRELERLEKAAAEARDASQRAGQRLTETVQRKAATDTLLASCRRFIEENGVRF